MTHRTAASRYARALFDVAQKEHQDLDTIERELAEFIDLLKQHPTFEKVLMNPAVPAPRKRAAVAAVIGQAEAVAGAREAAGAARRARSPDPAAGSGWRRSASGCSTSGRSCAPRS